MNKMSLFLYSLIIRIYYILILIASLFHWKAKKWINGRRHWQQKLRTNLSEELPKIWICCPSIGEFQECKTFVKRISEYKKDHQIIVTFHSPSGFDHAKIPGENSIRLMLPIDTKKNARTFLNIVNPAEMYILSTGVWPNYINELQKRKIPHYIVSFYGREDSAFFNPRLKFFYEPLFTSFEKIFCYNEKCQNLLKKNFNFERVEVVGNLRYDCVIDMKKNIRQINGIKEFVDGKFCIVAGSTEKKEDELLAKAFKTLSHLEIKWIIVPHEKLPRSLDKLQKMFGNEMCFYSNNIHNHKKVLVSDIWVDLFQLYNYANICLVGRGFDKLEIHNMLEPAVFFKPVLIGPKHKKFVEPKIFIEKKLAFEFNNEEELASLIYKFYTGDLKVDRNAINEMFEQNSKGTEIVMNSLINAHS